MYDNDISRFLEQFFRLSKGYTHEEKGILLMMLDYFWRNSLVFRPDNINENYRIFEIHTASEIAAYDKIINENFEETVNGYSLSRGSLFLELGPKQAE